MRGGRTILLAGTLTLTPLAATPTLATAPTKTADPVQAAAGWLAARVTAGALAPSSLADAVIAFAAAGVGANAAATAVVQLEASVDSYILSGATLQAGPLGKVMLAVAIAGGDVHSFGGHDLEADLRGLMAASGDDAGRFGSAMVYDQSLDILALATTASGVPPAAGTWLADKQCPDGDYSYDGTCPSFSPDPDSTAIAIQALQAAGASTALGNAETWLLAQQAGDGSLASWGTPNSSSTAAAAEAYRALGHTAEADHAAAYTATLQHGCDASAAYIGAIPWSGGGTFYLEMSTTQAMLGFGAGRLDQLSISGATAPAPTLACPEAPTGVAAVASTGEATVSWTAPADSPSPISSYIVMSGVGTRTCTPTPRTATSCTVRDLPDGRYTFSVVAINDLGVSRTSEPSNAVAIDTTAPVVTAPVVGLRAGGQLTGANVPVRVTWSGTDAVSGIHAYALERSADGGTTYDHPVVPGVPTATSINTTLAAGATSYRFHVRATDGGDNTSAWKAGTALGVSLVDDAAKITYSGAWTTSTPASASGATLHSATAKGASASITFIGRGIAWVAPKGSTRGKAAVYFDGAYAGTVNLNAASANRILVFAKSWTTSGRHTLRIVAAGTAGHPRIDVDAFVVVK